MTYTDDQRVRGMGNPKQKSYHDYMLAYSPYRDIAEVYSFILDQAGIRE